MKPFKHLHYIAVFLCMLVFLSCGGDMYAGGGIGGTGKTGSSGQVTAIGSVHVNGVRFDTRSADIYVDGELRGSGDDAVISNLDVGRVVYVDGTVDAEGAGTAVRVSYAPTLTGPIDRIETIDAHDTLVAILGQEVVINAGTTFKGTSPARLAPGHLIEVSGFIDDTARIQATFLYRMADTVTSGDPLRITGQVAGLDTARQRLFINGLGVRYDQADLTDLEPGGIANDMFVSIHGQWQGSSTEISAQVLRRHRRLADRVEGRIELEGIVGQDETTRQFSLEGYAFDVLPDIIYVGGRAEDLLPGMRIELEGDLSQGRIAAVKITFSQWFKVASNLAGIDRDAGRLEMAGLSALTIETNSLTRISGQADSLDNLTVGHHLIIKGWLVDDQTALANHVVALPIAKDQVALQGTLLNINRPLLSVNGTVVDTDTLPGDGFSLDDDDQTVSQDQFFAAIQQGDWVAVRGRLQPGDRVDWSSISLVVE